MAVALRPLARVQDHPWAFYEGYRMLGVDGTQFSLRNSPGVLAHASKSVSRRLEAAFAKLGTCFLVELGLHNPIAIEIGDRQESEFALGSRLLKRLPAQSLLMADRLYGSHRLLQELHAHCQSIGSQFLVRIARRNKSRPIELLADGSAIVEVRVRQTGQKFLVREIRGVVYGPTAQRVELRLWTSLTDWRKHPALELIKLYGRRWEQELFFKELKIHMRGGRSVGWSIAQHRCSRSCRLGAGTSLGCTDASESRSPGGSSAPESELRQNIGNDLQPLGDDPGSRRIVEAQPKANSHPALPGAYGPATLRTQTAAFLSKGSPTNYQRMASADQNFFPYSSHHL